MEILAHLRSCSDIWSYSILAMLAESSPALALLDPRKWAKAAGYPALGFHRSLEAFTLDRRELIAVLQGLEPEQWLRDADIGGRRHTVFSQARRMALHEAEHLSQFEAVVRCGQYPLVPPGINTLTVGRYSRGQPPGGVYPVGLRAAGPQPGFPGVNTLLCNPFENVKQPSWNLSIMDSGRNLTTPPAGGRT